MLAFEEIQLAAGAGHGGGRQCPTGAGFELQRPDGHIALGLRGPGSGRRGQRLQVGHAAGDAAEFDHTAFGIGLTRRWNGLGPQHREVRLGHLVARRQVQPDLEQLQRVGRVAFQQRKHLAVQDAATGGEPLHVAAAKAGRGTERIAVVDAAFAHDGHGLEAAVRVLREARHGHAVVHVPAVAVGEVLAHLPAGQRGLGPEVGRAFGVGVVVVDAKQERVEGRPGPGTQSLGVQDGGRGGGHGGKSGGATGRKRQSRGGYLPRLRAGLL